MDGVVALTADLLGTHFFHLEVAKVIASSSNSGRRVDLKSSFHALLAIKLFKLSALDSLSDFFGSDLTVLLASDGGFRAL